MADPTSGGPQPSAAPEPGLTVERKGLKRGILLGVIIAVIALAGIGLLLFLGYNIGLSTLGIGLAAAILPVPVLVFCFLWLDRYEPEPVRYLAIAFGWGAAVATSVALVVNTQASNAFERAGLPDDLVAVLVAPVIEETMKFLGPLLILLIWRREFSGITDGIVYCGLSAVGFAMVENILYLGDHAYRAEADQYGTASGLQALIATFIARILLSGFAHPLFTSISGIGLGIAARSVDRRVRWFAPIAGLLVAMILHGSWNLMSVLVKITGELLVLLYGYIAVMVPIFLGMLGFAIWLRSWEGRLTERKLPLYVRAGWLSPPEVAALATLGRRQSARRWARRVAGDAGARAMRDYQFAATQLALLRDGIDRGLDRKPAQAAQSASDERRLLTTISRARQAFTGRDPQAPPAVWDGRGYQIVFPDGVRRPLAAPAEPVVPIPVALPAGPPGYRPAPGYQLPPGGAPRYGPPPGYQSGYGGPPPGYQPGYGPPAGYGGPPPPGQPGPGQPGPPDGYR